MAAALSLSQMLAQLETKVAHHRERRSFHGEQEALHRERAAHHGAELEAALGRLEALQTAADSAGELLGRDKAAWRASAVNAADEALDVSGKRSLSRMLAEVVKSLPATEVFGAQTVTRSIVERWGTKLRRPPDSRSVSSTLRRWAQAGRIHQVRVGRSHHEALYRKSPPAERDRGSRG